MESFFYSVNATAPVFLVILLGYILRRIGILDEHFVSVCNRFNFKITLPVMLFVQMTETSLRDNFSGGFVLLCAVITVLSAVGIWIGARIFLKDRHMVGAFVQAGYRSSVAVLGMALVTNIYGSGAVVPMMMVGSVPLFNVFAVLILTICVALGLRGEYLAAVLVMQGSPTTSTGYVMAENMGGDGVLASSAVVSTTVLSAFSLTFWVFLSRSFGLI